MQHLPYLRTTKGNLRTYGRPTDKRPRAAPNRVRHRVPHSMMSLNLSPDKKSPWPTGFSRRARLSHEVLPATATATAMGYGHGLWAANMGSPGSGSFSLASVFCMLGIGIPVRQVHRPWIPPDTAGGLRSGDGGHLELLVAST
jgi:hypothetical protein